MGIIYKVTCLINGKVYIGQTINSLAKRKSQHIYNAIDKDNNKFHNAIRKYGEENFNWEIIEEIDNDLLDDREIYWIQYYNSYKSGYNSTIGGNSGLKRNDKIIKELFQNGLNGQQISEQTGYSSSTVYISLKNLGLLEEAYKRWRQQVGDKNGLQIEQYDIKGNLIDIYKSVSEASRQTQIAVSAISRAALLQCRSAGKFLWRYSDSKITVEELVKRYNAPLLTGKGKQIGKFDAQGHLIDCYRSISEAARENKCDRKWLSACIKNKKPAYGFFWTILEEDISF